jgi:hypothetical protein
MNKLAIIGNGFDLAHGLKTSYEDFILWHFFECYKKNRNNPNENDLIKINGNAEYSDLKSFKSISHFKELITPNYFKIDFTYSFVKEIIKEIEYSWVDIEKEYFLFLKSNLKYHMTNNIDKVDDMKNFVNLNICVDKIKIKLQEYLSTLEKPAINNDIKTYLNWFTKHSVEFNPNVDKIVFLNFNYTSTIEIYLSMISNLQISVNYIHGKLNDNYNPIIFGYGDETDDNYEKIEKLNNNELLNHMKSFAYLKTSNYRDLFNFLDSSDFDVHILGHSCGLSDRLLFTHIFEHNNLNSVKIYYYQKSEIENDFFEKTQNISRYFRLDSKHRMRTKVVPFNESKPLTTFTKLN